MDEKMKGSKAPAQTEVLAPANLEEVRTNILRQLSGEETPSVSISVVHAGSVAWMESIGWADREAGILATPLTRYFVASVSKSLTSTAAVELIGQGRMSRESPVTKALPGLQLPATGFPMNDVTIGHLMGHTSGIPHLWHYEFPDRPETIVTGRELLTANGFRAFPSGSQYHYSNLGMELLAEVVRGEMQTDFQTAMSRLVFEPLGMQQTTSDAWLGGAGAVRGYDGAGAAIDYTYRMGPAGGAGFFASLSDLTRYCIFHLGGMQDCGLKDSTRVSAGVSDFPMGFYLNGWGVIRTPSGPVLLSDGEAAGATAVVLLAPEQKLGVVALSNQTGGQSLSTTFQVLAAYDGAMAESCGGAIEVIEREIAQPGYFGAQVCVGTLEYKKQSIPTRMERWDEAPAKLTIGEDTFELGEVAWEWGAMTASLIGPGWQGSRRPDGHRLTLRLWPMDTGACGILMEQDQGDRPTSGQPYFIEMEDQRPPDK